MCLVDKDLRTTRRFQLQQVNRSTLFILEVSISVGEKGPTAQHSGPGPATECQEQVTLASCLMKVSRSGSI